MDHAWDDDPRPDLDEADDLDRPPAPIDPALHLGAPDVPRLAFAAAMVAFSILVAGSFFGRPTMVLAVLVCVVLVVAAAARLLPAAWWTRVAALGTVASLGLLVVL